jgi:hypothetical protein
MEHNEDHASMRSGHKHKIEQKSRSNYIFHAGSLSPVANLFAASRSAWSAR